MAGAEPVILDTCALLWVTQGGGALSAATLQRIDTLLGRVVQHLNALSSNPKRNTRSGASRS